MPAYGSAAGDLLVFGDVHVYDGFVGKCRIRAPRSETEAVFEDKPLVDVDPADYEEVAG